MGPGEKIFAISYFSLVAHRPHLDFCRLLGVERSTRNETCGYGHTFGVSFSLVVFL